MTGMLAGKAGSCTHMRFVRYLLTFVEQYRSLRWALMLFACLLFALALGELYSGLVILNQDHLHMIPTNSTITAAGGNDRAVIHSVITAAEATIVGCCVFWIGFAHGRNSRSVSAVLSGNAAGALDNPYAPPGS